MTLLLFKVFFKKTGFKIIYLMQAPFLSSVFPIIHFYEAVNQPGLIKFYMRSSFNEGLTVRCAKG